MLNKSALNVIHSNCTNSRPDGHRVYGDCICSINPQKYRISAKSGNSKPCYCHLLKTGMRNKPPIVQALKTVWSNGCYPNALCVLPKGEKTQLGNGNIDRTVRKVPFP